MTYRMTFRTIHNGIHNIQDIKGDCQDIDMSITGPTQILNTTFTMLHTTYTTSTGCSQCLWKPIYFEVFHPIRPDHILYITFRILYTVYTVLLHHVYLVALMAIFKTYKTKTRPSGCKHDVHNFQHAGHDDTGHIHNNYIF